MNDVSWYVIICVRPTYVSLMKVPIDRVNFYKNGFPIPHSMAFGRESTTLTITWSRLLALVCEVAPRSMGFKWLFCDKCVSKRWLVLNGVGRSQH